MSIPFANTIVCQGGPGNTHCPAGRAPYPASRGRARFTDFDALQEPLVDFVYHGSPFFIFYRASNDNSRL